VPESSAKKLSQVTINLPAHMPKLGPRVLARKGLAAKPTAGGLYWKGQRDGNNF
jgi:hypothetical protein